MSNKIVVNGEYGGFMLSKEAITWLKSNYSLDEGDIIDLPRHDHRLVECIETLGKRASEGWSDIYVTEIEGNKYFIDEYDGLETVVEPKDINWIEI